MTLYSMKKVKEEMELLEFIATYDEMRRQFLLLQKQHQQHQQWHKTRIG